MSGDHDHPHTDSDHGPGNSHGHSHSHSHNHSHGHSGPAAPGATWRYLAAGLLLVLGLAAATMQLVRAGSAAVVTRFGNPVRVVTEPGLAWKFPAPIERAVEVDLRLHTTASGIHGVLTKDGLSIVVQAWVAWKVPGNDDTIRHFLRAVQNNPDEAANKLRTLLGSSLETVTSRFELAQLLNTDPARVQLDVYEQALRESISVQGQTQFGIAIAGVGIERLMLPETTVGATISRMAAERDTVAEEKKANGRRTAGQIRTDAERDARIAKAKANQEASSIEANAGTEAARIYEVSHQTDPQLYTFLRSLDTLEEILSPTSRLVLRTDAAPFRALVEMPTFSSAPAAGTTHVEASKP
jgi:membrane protease subunit HflC